MQERWTKYALARYKAREIDEESALKNETTALMLSRDAALTHTILSSSLSLSLSFPEDRKIAEFIFIFPRGCS